MGDILDLAVAEIVEIIVNFSIDLLVHRARNQNTAWFGETFQSSGYIHAIPKNIVSLDHDIAEIDANLKLNALVGGNLSLTFVHAELNFQSAAYSLDRTRELHQ